MKFRKERNEKERKERLLIVLCQSAFPIHVDCLIRF